jgi:hypothetical protein
MDTSLLGGTRIRSQRKYCLSRQSKFDPTREEWPCIQQQANSHHINIRYFFVTDRVKSGEVSIDYCPTDDMIADFFTKPLQGTKFRKFRDIIMNVDPMTTNHQDHRSVLGTKKIIVLELPTMTWSDVVKNVTTSNENVTVVDGNARMSHWNEKTDTDEKHSE